MLIAGPEDAAALQGLGVGNWYWDIISGGFRWSEELRRIYGIAADADLGVESFRKLVHLDDRAHAMAVVRSTLSSRRGSHEHQFRIVRPDGEIRYLLSRAVLSCDDKGEPASLTGVDIDLGSEGAADQRVEGALREASGIADADRAGDAFAPLGAEDRLCPKEMDTLRQSENLYRSALQALPAHVAILDARGGIIAVNDAWKAFAANNQSSAISHLAVGTNYLEICRKAANTDPLAERALAGIVGVLTGRLPQFELEYPCHSPSEQRWFLMTVLPIDSGSWNGVVITHINITARRAAEEALRDSEETFRTIVTTAQGGLWAADGEKRTKFVNPRMAELLGVSPSSMLGKPVADYCLPEDLGRLRERFAANLGGRDEEFEWRFRHSEGHTVPVLASTAPLKDRDGKTIGSLGAFVDLTERKAAEDRQRVLMLELAHRGKNLLAVVGSIASLTFDYAVSVDQVREAFLGRLQALSRTYGNLTDEVFSGAPLDEIVSSGLDLFAARAKYSGPKVMLTARAAQTFALIVHELATNSAKYGALSVSDGCLKIDWNVFGADDERRLSFSWTETGGPPAAEPERKGFGTTIISTIAAHQYDCEPKLSFGAAGFSYAFDAPLENFGTVIENTSIRAKLCADVLRALYDAWTSQSVQNGQLPTFARFDRSQFAGSGCVTVARITSTGAIRFIEVGHTLTHALGRAVPKVELAVGNASGFVEAYRRCARDGQPYYENLRYDLNEADPVTFERLLVPFSSTGASRVTHVAGIAICSGAVKSDELVM